MKSKLIWTKEDRILFSKIMDYAKETSRRASDTFLGWEDMVTCLKQAKEVSGRKICNDCPDYIEKLLTKEQWKKLWVEFHHYNGDVEEISSPRDSSLPDFCLYFFFSHKLSEIKSVPLPYQAE